MSVGGLCEDVSEEGEEMAGIHAVETVEEAVETHSQVHHVHLQHIRCKTQHSVSFYNKNNTDLMKHLTKTTPVYNELSGCNGYHYANRLIYHI